MLEILFLSLIFSSSAFANGITDVYQWQSPAPTLLSAMESSNRYVNFGQGWEEYAGILACYNSKSEGLFCTINPIGSSVMDNKNIQDALRVQGTSILMSVLENSNSYVGEAFVSGVSAKFLFVRCYKPVGTGNLNDMPYCETSTHNEESN